MKYTKEFLNQYETDSLIEMVVEAGIPLPTYDYQYKKFITAVFANVRIDEKNITLFLDDVHDTFKEACISTLIYFKTS